MLAIFTLTATVVTAPAVTVYVSDHGSDFAPGTEARPFRTIERALDEVRKDRRGGDARPATIRLSGAFEIKQALDLGSELNDLTLASYGAAPATVSGGLTLRRWTPKGNAWAADVPPAPAYRQLFADGKARVPVASIPDSGFAHLASLEGGAENGPWNVGQDAARFNPQDVPEIRHPEDVEFVANHYWVQSRMRLKSIDRTQTRFVFDRKSVFRLTDDYTGKAAPYRLENVAEALAPGRFVYDGTDHRILYDTGGHAAPTAVVGRLPVLLHAHGVHNLAIRNLRFAYSEWQPPADSAGDGQAAISVPGAVLLEDCNQALLDHCVLEHLGTYGIEVKGNSTDVAIRRCSLDDLGGGGIKIGPGTTRTSVEDCALHRLGRIFASAIGIWIGDSGHNVIAHNRIEDLYYTAISVGWTWGYGPSRAVDNRIEANDIADVGQGALSDMGGIYTLGVSPGTVLKGNRIRRVEARGYGGWGIYLDEGSSGILVEGNLVEGTKTGSFHQHYGQDNVIRDNVFLFAREAGQVIRSRKEDHRSFTFENNVVEWQGTDLLGGNLDGGFDFDRNVYWRTDGAPSFAGKSFAQWQALGYDRHSLVADPRLRVSERGVRFGPDSPAARLGIAPLDLSRVGPRR